MKIDKNRLQQLALCAEKHTQSGELSSVEWKIIHGGNVVDRGLVGMADALQGSALPHDPIYRIYSMTKPIVSVLALQLMEEGVLSLPQPVAHYLPQVASMQNHATGQVCGNLMTVEHLLTHRAGFSYDFLPDCKVAELYRERSLADNGAPSLTELVDTLTEMPLSFSPGAQWKYSYSIDVLARVLEIASGSSLPELLQQRIFKPCGMNNTGFMVSASERSRLLPMFGQSMLGSVVELNSDPQQLYSMDCEQSHPAHDDRFVRGGHGLYSTADDYTAFLPVLMTGKTPDGDVLLSASMVDFMWHNRIPSSQQPLMIAEKPLGGYGWNMFGRVMIDPGQASFLTACGEGGWAGAASTYFWVDRTREFCGVVMTQYLGGTVPIGDYMRTAAYQSLV